MVRHPNEETPCPTIPTKPDSKVVIRHNPHHPSAQDIIGTVVRFEPGAGFMGCDLAYVCYEDVRDGQVHEMPFGTANLEPGSPEVLLEVAERYEARAAELRRMAEAARG